MATSGKSEKGGFDCDFVQKPPEAFQSECPLCLQILREPHQAPCCGNSFCRVCVERIKINHHGNKPCPTCKDENFTTFHNKGLQRSLYGFQVYCSHKQEGCEWKGELGQLDNHLRVCSEYSPCDFHHVGCDVKLPRKDMPAHLKENLVTHMSLQAASYYKLLASHKELQASHASLQARQKEMQARHTTLQTSHNELQEKVKMLENENEAIKLQLETNLEPQQAAIPITPIRLDQLYVLRNHEVVMNGFTELKSEDDEWHSPPFYSHQGGYKFCLEVHPNGNGPGHGTHLSVFTVLMKGENDNRLQFPFRGKIVVEMVDQKLGRDHHKAIIPYNDDTPWVQADRVRAGTRNTGRGHPKFMQISKLQPKYLRNDTICFRIVKFKFDV